MTALRKVLFVEEEPRVATPLARAPAPKLYIVRTDKAPARAHAEAPEAAGGTLKNILLFFAAPFIGLAYIVLLPFVGLGLLALLAMRAAAKVNALKAAVVALRNVVLLMAAPALGLAYIVFFPVVGLAALVWLGGRAALEAGRGA